jgi:hypothetical protein
MSNPSRYEGATGFSEGNGLVHLPSLPGRERWFFILDKKRKS